MAHRLCVRAAAVAPRLVLRTAVVPKAPCFRGFRGHALALSGSSSGRRPALSPLVRRFSSAPSSESVSYDEMKRIVDGQLCAVIIDVREPWELREYGAFPGALNVPLGQINTALRLEAEEFEEKFGGAMPEQTDSIVFTCLAGVRSKTALDTATSLGYQRVQHYPGGWQEWEQNHKSKS